VHGHVVPDPFHFTANALDLAALENGGTVVACSNMFYSSPTNLISPDHARIMGEGWETARRRDDGNDWVEIALAGPGVVRIAELDTSYFLGNAPGWASLSGYDARVGQQPGDAVELLPRQRLQPDTRHRFRLPASGELTHVRLDVYPDGGMARMRLWGALTDPGREDLVLRWYNLLPAIQVLRILGELGLSSVDAETAVKARPVADRRDLPEALRTELPI
jgi:allantoicase